MRAPSSETAEADLLIALAAASEERRPALFRWAAARHCGAAGGADGIGDADPAPPPAEAAELVLRAPAIAALERERAAARGASILTLADAGYPAVFRTLELPPPAIYVQGALPDAPAVAIVGARKASAYGLEVARWFGRELAAAGVTVVSGFARGVDTAAHEGALERGATVAALGCGLDVDYPQGHGELAERIATRGARVSEFPFGSPPFQWHFPVRNRLIAALASACVVVEAAARSGSLVTARLALDLGREVLAVPGRVIDEVALGANSLLAEGARPALDPRDVLEAIGLEPGARTAFAAREPRGLAPATLALWRAASAEPASCERLAARAGLDAAPALAATLELELLGLLRRRADGIYEAVA